MFTYNLVDKPDMHHHTEAIGRVYGTPTGEKYPSITTILGKQDKPGLDAWRERVGAEEADRIMKVSAKTGNKLHKQCELFVMGDELKTLDHGTHLLFGAVKPFLKRNLSNIRGIEIPLWSHYLKTAGRADLIADWDGVPSIIDYKNSRSEKPKDWCHDYFMQGAAYSHMFHEVYGETYKQVVIVIAQWGRPVKVYKEQVRDWVKPLHKVMREHNPLWR